MQDDDATRSTYERMGGAPIVDLLVERFYAEMDSNPDATSIRAMHGADLALMKQTLKRYLAEWLGGPKLYSAEKGHPRLRQRHMPFAIGAEERDAWLHCMRRALDDAVTETETREKIFGAMAKLADWMRNKPGNPHDTRQQS
jgi:hemoglobin